MNAAVPIGILAIAYTVLTKGNALRTLNFYPASVRDIKFTGGYPVMTIGLAVQNTSNQRFVIRSLAGNIYSNGTLVGNVGSFLPMAINPNSQTTLFVTVRLSLIGLVQNLIDAFTGNGTQQNIEFEAMANVDHYQIPVELKYKVG